MFSQAFVSVHGGGGGGGGGGLGVPGPYWEVYPSLCSQVLSREWIPQSLVPSPFWEEGVAQDRGSPIGQERGNPPPHPLDPGP